MRLGTKPRTKEGLPQPSLTSHHKMSQISPTMAAGLSRYKLQTEFYPNTVVHTTHRSNLYQGLRKTVVKTTWTRYTELGSGAFGVVWSEHNTATADMRAVKIISKASFKNFRELDALAELQDVRLSQTSVFIRQNLYNVHAADGIPAPRTLHIVPRLVRRPAFHLHCDGVHRRRGPK